MRVHIVAVGKVKRGAEADLVETYAGRLSWDLSIREVEEKKPLTGDKLKAREAELIRGALPAGAAVVALDERGRDLSSRDLAGKMEGWRDAGRDVAFVIGGADGLDPDFRKSADLVLSFGRLTWPHQMVRAMLAEQIYRCETILSGHPYHRD